jgi:hypothetical protein
MKLPVIWDFSLVSSPVSHFLNVIFLNTQFSASLAISLYFAEKIPSMPNTINAITQIMIKIDNYLSLLNLWIFPAL